jgi:hypothetical protein
VQKNGDVEEIQTSSNTVRRGTESNTKSENKYSSPPPPAPQNHTPYTPRNPHSSPTWATDSPSEERGAITGEKEGYFEFELVCIRDGVWWGIGKEKEGGREGDVIGGECVEWKLTVWEMDWARLDPVGSGLTQVCFEESLAAHAG